MKLVRLHASIFDQPPSEKQSTVAFVELDTMIPDDQELADYLGGLTVRCYVSDDASDTRATADLTPTLVRPAADYFGTNPPGHVGT